MRRENTDRFHLLILYTYGSNAKTFIFLFLHNNVFCFDRLKVSYSIQTFHAVHVSLLLNQTSSNEEINQFGLFILQICLMSQDNFF